VLQGVRNRFGIYGVEDQSIDTGITWFLSSIKFFSVNLVACDLELSGPFLGPLFE
jgi:hypothetical protein